MRRSATILLFAGFLGGCASPANDYLSRISMALPAEIQGNMSDRLEDGGEPGNISADPPSFSDFPPSRVLVWRQTRSAPDAVRFYDMAGLTKDRSVISAAARLDKTMRERKSATQLRSLDQDLPLYPPQSAGFLVQDKISYEEFEWGSGVFFLAQFTQSRGMFPNNKELTYQFQGISRDRRLFVRAEFSVTNPILPASLESVSQTETIDDDAEEMAKRLDRQPDDSFDPNLAVIRSWIASIKLPQP